MIEGFYSIAFTGAAGSSIGILVLTNGIVTGADAGGATYDGSYVENAKTGSLDAEVTMNAPAGVAPVQTGIPLSTPVKIPINTAFPRDLGAEKPVRIETPIGPINIVFKKIRDFPSNH